jgi:hypothetical protein
MNVDMYMYLRLCVWLTSVGRKCILHLCHELTGTTPIVFGENLIRSLKRRLLPFSWRWFIIDIL